MMGDQHIPRRDDAVATWLREYRNVYGPPFISDLDHIRWYAIDDVLEDYRLHADTGTPIDQDVSENGW